MHTCTYVLLLGPTKGEDSWANHFRPGVFEPTNRENKLIALRHFLKTLDPLIMLLGFLTNRNTIDVTYKTFYIFTNK